MDGPKADANTLTRDGERHVHRRTPDAGDAVSGESDRFDVDVGELRTQDSEPKTQAQRVI